MLYRSGITTHLKGKNVMNDSEKRKMMSTNRRKGVGISLSTSKYLNVVIYGYHRKIMPFKSCDILPVSQLYVKLRYIESTTD